MSSKQGRNFLVEITISDDQDLDDISRKLESTIVGYMKCLVKEKNEKTKTIEMCIQTSKKVTISRIFSELNPYQVTAVDFISLSKLFEFAVENGESSMRMFGFGKPFGNGAKYHRCKKSESVIDIMLSKYKSLDEDYSIFREWLYGSGQTKLIVSEEQFKNYLDKIDRFEIQKRKKLLAEKWLNSTPLHVWQKTLLNYLNQAPSDRQILFVFDPPGNTGKTTIQNKLQEAKPDQIIRVSCTKAKDMAYIVKNEYRLTVNTIFIDVPRAIIIDTNHCVFLEQLKDG